LDILLSFHIVLRCIAWIFPTLKPAILIKIRCYRNSEQGHRFFDLIYAAALNVATAHAHGSPGPGELYVADVSPSIGIPQIFAFHQWCASCGHGPWS
ncbi:MAG TPA: hypothetical protein VLQ47_09845, partial [Rhodoferax sp.]|nr:hypothetical protein [Rhodoferax sp.]